MNYREQVWRDALQNAEQDVLRACSIPDGGRKKNETLELLVERVRDAQDKALARVDIARRELQAALAARPGGETNVP